MSGPLTHQAHAKDEDRRGAAQGSAPSLDWAQTDLEGVGLLVLTEPDPGQKARIGVAAEKAWHEGALRWGRRTVTPPDRPGRLDHPELRDPADMPRRKTGGEKGRIALLHALAHIELNAINLAWDMIARFGAVIDDPAFCADWVSVAGDESRHFLMLEERLETLGARYGDLPAHDGLWEAAQATAQDVLARLAVVPLVLEARGLDVCPDMIAKLKAAGDLGSAAVLQVIYEEEINHVRIGWRWFSAICTAREQSLKDTWQDLVRRHFRGTVKAPFNDEARVQAGLPQDFYQPIAQG